MDENQAGTSSTPRMSSKNTPRQGIFHQHIGTPLQRIKERETPEKEDGLRTPVTINPFEVKPDSLYFASCSPSVFATFARNKIDNVSIK